MKRRDFIKGSIMATSGIVVMDSFLGCMNPALKQPYLDDYFNAFKEPPAEARLFVRWWWNGNRLSSKEILRELDVMKEAGIGGVEINPIAFPQDCDPAGHKAMTIFEDDWLEMLQVALEGAQERGIICDMIVGSGWPFGGEFLEKDYQSQMVTIETLDLDGGRTYSFSLDELKERVNPEIHSKHDLVYRDILMARLVPKKTDSFTEGEDQMENISNNELRVDVPEGKWVLYYVVKLTGYMAVINGSPGAAGPVLNHYSEPATEYYLNRISDFINGKVGNMGDYIRAMFCDSMELEGANWNDDLPAEFEKRRGYSILPFLPFVLKKVGHMGNPLEEEYGTEFPPEVLDYLNRIDLDYYKTRMELFKERFIDTFNDWCHRNNTLSRMQAYGRGMHPLEASMEIDLPDSETWLSRSVGTIHPDTGLTGRAPSMSNKFVASGAALSGRKVVSCEEITNTSMVFMATLERIKVAGDQSNISGVNHSILHGFNYSPPDVPFPGWIRYGTFYNEQNPWWPYFRLWSDYKARISYLLQQSIPRANVAILQPLTDLWLKMGPQRDPFPHKWYPEYQHNLWEVIHQNGGGCDYVSEKIIRESSFEKGSMKYNERQYDTLLLPEIETLDLETANAISAFAEAGGTVVFIGKRPFKSPEKDGKKSNDAIVKQLIDGMVGASGLKVLDYPAPDGNLIKWYGRLQEELEIQPFVRFDRPGEFLSHSPYLLGDNSLYFIANTSMVENITVQASFTDKEGIPWVWDPETGERYLYPGKGDKTIDLYLPRSTSIMIMLENGSKGKEYVPYPRISGGQEVQGPWTLKLEHMNGTRTAMKMEGLTELTSLEETRDFGGVVTYNCVFNSGNAERQYIDLGHVEGVSELTLNGKSLGTRWYGAHVYETGGILQKGENSLSVKLTTICGNYVKSMKESPLAQRWTGRQAHSPMGIMGPVRIF